MIEIGGLLTVYSGAAYSLRLSVFEIGAGALQTAFTQPGAEKLRDFCRGSGPSAADGQPVFCTGFWRRSGRSIFLLQEAGQLPWMPAALGAAVCVLLLAVVPTAFLFHSCLIEQKSFRDGPAPQHGTAEGAAGEDSVSHGGVSGGLRGSGGGDLWNLRISGGGADGGVCGTGLQLAFLMQTADRIEAAVLISGVHSRSGSVFRGADGSVLSVQQQTGRRCQTLGFFLYPEPSGQRQKRAGSLVRRRHRGGFLPV